ncbi:TatD DNase family protein [Salana multivorans]|uniref:TatD DNase family protein n=1 Tax=Salana multivorans TaxID=120377 RepID=A0A3N2D7Z5_9MICO|nr:TatD family hydrolase [Salana multivorans]ROR95900.1 TatD DNase family protein [Salana multivorans]
MSRKHRPTGWPPAPEPLPGPVVDDHTHLDSLAEWVAPGWGASEDDDAPVPLAAHLGRAAGVGVDRVVTVACDVDAIRWTDAFLRDLEDGVLAGVGVLAAAAIHPNEAALHAGVREIAPDGLDPDPRPRHDLQLDEAIALVAATVRANPRFRAIGETGLDFFRAGPRGRAVQREAFRAHVALAKELGLPLQIHDRDAHADVVEILLADGAPERTVFHCFSGDVELARTCAEHGWYLSIAGPVTFRANDQLRAAVGSVPLELLLTETDAPYLTPHPDRGRPNSPYLLPATLREIARVRDEPLERVCAVTAATAEGLYGPW